MNQKEKVEAARKIADANMSSAERADLFGRLVDAVEDFLEEKGIIPEDIPNEDREGNDGEAIIFGADYDYLADQFAEILGIARYG